MNCRACGACCEAISISSPLPGLPMGKPAGVRCPHLNGNLCSIWGKPERPAVCASYRATPDFCGSSREEAVRLITMAELLTKRQSVARP